MQDRQPFCRLIFEALKLLYNLARGKALGSLIAVIDDHFRNEHIKIYALRQEYILGDVIASPCPLCQTNVEIYQDQINEKFGYGGY